MNDYPQSAVNICKRVLKFRDDNPKMDCGTAVGWQRANQIAKRENLSNETIKRTYSFLSRAKTYDTGSFKDSEGKYVCGSIMYAAWGGNPMLAWCKKVVEKMDEKNVIELKGGIGDFYSNSKYFDYLLNQFEDKTKDLEVYIDSLGGSFVDAVSIYQSLKKYKGNTTAVYNGLCASAATVIASGCDTVKATEVGSAVLIHKVMQGLSIHGHFNSDDIDSLIKKLQAEKENLNTLDGLAASIYAKRGGKKVEDMMNQMTSNTWLSVEKALELGLIDEIIPSNEKKTADEKINELQNKIQGLELVNNVTLPKLLINDNNKDDMNIKETISNFFGDKKDVKLTNDDVQNLATTLSNEIENEVKTLRNELQELKESAKKDTSKDNQIGTELTNRIEKIEQRDTEIGQILTGFINTIKTEFKDTLAEHEQRIENKITELQLKENSIVTGDKSFNEKVTTEDWIKQLENLKNY